MSLARDKVSVEIMKKKRKRKESAFPKWETLNSSQTFALALFRWPETNGKEKHLGHLVLHCQDGKQNCAGESKMPGEGSLHYIH